MSAVDEGLAAAVQRVITAVRDHRDLACFDHPDDLCCTCGFHGAPDGLAMRDHRVLAIARAAREDVPALTQQARADGCDEAIQRVVAAWDNAISFEPCEPCPRSGVALWERDSEIEMEAAVEQLRAAAIREGGK